MVSVKKIFLTLFLATLFSGYGQNDTEVLMTINDAPVYVEDFKRVYLKNLDLVEDESQKDIDTYLELFKKYRLKLAQAYSLELDKKADLQNELEGYSRQLAENYMTDAPVTEALINEAYAHTIEEVEASHIMISLQEAQTPEDTVAAFAKISKIREQIINGADFTTTAKQESEDPSARENAGYLGWFHAFKMVYPFEKAAYETPVGEVSKIVRSKYGYHILNILDKRKNRGEIKVAHIIVTDQDANVNPEMRIKEIYQKLKQGESFESLAVKYSDDRQSAVKGGELNAFSAGQLRSLVFEEKAFALQNTGDYTEPFKTELGWHIVKLLQKIPVPSLQELRPVLENKIKSDARSSLVEEALLVKLNDQHAVQRFEEVVLAFAKKNPESLMQGKWQLQLTEEEKNKTALIIEDEKFTYNDFAGFVKQGQRGAPAFKDAESFLKATYFQFVNYLLKRYHREHLAEINEEYAQIVKEYKEGILLFALMEEKIWNKAQQDSVGLKNFFEANQKDYQWPERFKVLVASSPNKKSAQEVLKLLQQGKSQYVIKEQLNKDGLVNVFFTNATVVKDDKLLPDGYIPAMGLSKIYEGEDYTIVKLEEKLLAQAKKLNEVKGRVINDYQDLLEKQWLEELQKNYEVIVNEPVLMKLKKELSH